MNWCEKVKTIDFSHTKKHLTIIMKQNILIKKISQSINYCINEFVWINHFNCNYYDNHHHNDDVINDTEEDFPQQQQQQQNNNWMTGWMLLLLHNIINLKNQITGSFKLRSRWFFHYNKNEMTTKTLLQNSQALWTITTTTKQNKRNDWQFGHHGAMWNSDIGSVENWSIQRKWERKRYTL